MVEEKSIYLQLKEAGVQLDNHESDLYALVTDESKRILQSYKYKSQVTTFKSEIDKKLWFDIPFAFEPYWERKA